VLEDTTQLTQELIPYATAAIGVYGAAVLTRVGDDSADATVSFGRRVLCRLTGRTGVPEGEEPAAEQAELARVIGELAQAWDADAPAVLRWRIRRVLAETPGLGAEIAGWPRPPVPGTAVVSSTGDRSPAVHTNYGTIHTGDRTPPSDDETTPT
jgi:hypothetical protein